MSEQVNTIQPDQNAFIEAIRAQRTEHADACAKWFAMYVAAEAKVKELEKKISELEKPEAKPPAD